MMEYNYMEVAACTTPLTHMGQRGGHMDYIGSGPTNSTGGLPPIVIDMCDVFFILVVQVAVYIFNGCRTKKKKCKEIGDIYSCPCSFLVDKTTLREV
jgi:hypothetical protein